MLLFTINPIAFVAIIFLGLAVIYLMTITKKEPEQEAQDNFSSEALVERAETPFYVEPKRINVRIKGRRKIYSAIPKSGRNAIDCMDYDYFDEFGELVEDIVMMEVLFGFFSQDGYEDDYIDLTEEYESVEAEPVFTEELDVVQYDQTVHLSPEVYEEEVEIVDTIPEAEEIVYEPVAEEPTYKNTSSSSKYEDYGSSDDDSSDDGDDD